MRDLRILLLLFFHCLCACISQKEEYPAVLYDAVKYAQEKNPESALETIQTQEIHAIAQEWLDDGREQEAHKLFLYLAEEGYVPSMAKMGHLYSRQEDDDSALTWFRKAGSQGHHSSMYNVGQLLSNKKDYVGALHYLQAAARLHQTKPDYASEEVTDVAKKAFEGVCKEITQTDMSLKQAADAFMFGTLEEVSEQLEMQWSQVILGLIKKGGALDHDALLESAVGLQELLATNATSYSSLQRYIMMSLIVDLAIPLSEVDESWLPVAATNAESLSLNPYCWDAYNDSESSPGCFNTAVATALSTYGKLGDEESVQRVIERANAHPEAVKNSKHWVLPQK